MTLFFSKLFSYFLTDCQDREYCFAEVVYRLADPGPGLGLLGPQATVIVGPQPPHTPTISISCYFIKRIPIYHYSEAFFFINLGGPLSLGAPKHCFFCFYVSPPLSWPDKGYIFADYFALHYNFVFLGRNIVL